MNKLIKKISSLIGIVILNLAMFNTMALAEGDKVDINDVLYRSAETYESDAVNYPETIHVAHLPDVEVDSIITVTVKTILEWAMLIALVAIVIAAIYYIISKGQEEDISKAKDIILYLVIGMAIMAAAYGIIAGLTKFEFF